MLVSSLRVTARNAIMATHSTVTPGSGAALVASVQRGQRRGFAKPININMYDSEFNAPASEKALYCNQFVQKHPSEHAKDMETAVKHPVVHDTTELIPALSADPHQTYGVAEWMHLHYEATREPTFPRKPDIAKGELASGANLIRTDVWADAKEPAIASIAKFEPNYYRPVGYAENAPMPDSTCPDNTLDFRHNRLPIGHADRRPWLYFISAATGFFATSFARVCICKLLLVWWPPKNVFAAGVVEVDIRPIYEGQNFTVKWRSKPVFLRKRTDAMIKAAQKDDVLVPSMRDPETDAERCPKPEWLITIGVCTHLGCIPQPDAGLFGGYFCPCHGSHYDHAGRIRMGPAPKNLEIPPYTFLDDFTLKLG